MQSAVLQFPTDETMSITEGRFNKLVERVNDIGDRLAKVEGANGPTAARRNKWTDWLPIGVPVVALMTLMVTAGIYLDSKIGSIQTRLGKIDSAVKALGDAQKAPIKELVHDLLAVAKEAAKDNPEIAQRATRTATAFIATMKKSRLPADTDYFETTVSELNAIGVSTPHPPVSKAVQLTRAALAEYRSALEPLPVTGATFIFSKLEHAMVIGAHDLTFGPNINFDFRNITGDGIVLKADNGKVPENVVFQGDIIQGGTQLLDGIHWRNVTFVGAHIRYEGGPIELKDVRFVNCTFEFPYTDRGIRVANYAALLPHNPLIVG